MVPCLNYPPTTPKPFATRNKRGTGNISRDVRKPDCDEQKGIGEAARDVLRGRRGYCQDHRHV